MKRIVRYLTLGMLALVVPGAAMALTIDEFNAAYSNFNFGVLSQGGVSDDDLAALDFDLVLETDGTYVTMTFSNVSSVESVIAQIYLHDSGEALLGSPTILSPMVNNELKFVVGSGSPTNLPGGNDPGVNFAANTALSVYASSPAPKNGIGQTESLVLQYTLLTDITTLSDALQDGTLRFGMHVQSIGDDGNSLSFVGTPDELPPPPPPQDPVPEPATLVLLCMGTSFLAVRKRFSC